MTQTFISTSGKTRLLIGCSGSVATLKIPELVAELVDIFEVKLVVTANALFFLERAKVYNPEAWKRFEGAGGLGLCILDKHEWDEWSQLGSSVIHIELRRWADILLIAPASANLIAKASAGVSDNLLLSVLRAWDFSKPLILCPAMNTVMWDHPITSTSLSTLQSWGYEVLGPVEKLLACNERGNGALVSVQEIKLHLIQKTSSALIDKQHAAVSLTTNNTSTSTTAISKYSSIESGHSRNIDSFLSNLCTSPIVTASYSDSSLNSGMWTRLAALLVVGIGIGIGFGATSSAIRYSINK